MRVNVQRPNDHLTSTWFDHHLIDEFSVYAPFKAASETHTFTFISRDGQSVIHAVFQRPFNGWYVHVSKMNPIDITSRDVLCAPFDNSGYFQCRVENGEPAKAIHEWTNGDRTGYFCPFHSPYDKDSPRILHERFADPTINAEHRSTQL